MDEQMIHAYAKINLSLGVGMRGSDGYHPVDTVLCSVDCRDTVHIATAEHGIAVETDSVHLPTDERNIAYRAAACFLAAAGIEAGVRIRIQKRIPIAAGLAGGSADAAAVLMGIQRLFEGPLSSEVLVSLAASLGSDVPFCMGEGLARATGRGTDVQYLPPLASGPAFVLVNPGVPLSTAEVYNRFDDMAPGPRPDTEGLIRALGDADWAGAASRMANMLEPAAVSLCPTIPLIQEALLDKGALTAVMSGSGPTVYGFFADMQAAQAAADTLKGAYPFVRAASPVPRGVRLE
jgi:4-diphosphocytidyl-2-C-methyl-D-erythritol kinase